MEHSFVAATGSCLVSNIKFSSIHFTLLYYISLTAILAWVKYSFYQYPEQLKADFSHLSVLVYQGSFFQGATELIKVQR